MNEVDDKARANLTPENIVPEMAPTRPDGRSEDQIRSLSAQLNVTESSQGSVLFSQGEFRSLKDHDDLELTCNFFPGDTAVLCSVSGPKEARLKDENYNQANYEVSWVPSTSGSGEESADVFTVFIFPFADFSHCLKGPRTELLSILRLRSYDRLLATRLLREQLSKWTFKSFTTMVQ